ncbi:MULTISPECIES: PEP-CTERM sorting domain-containing protein [Halomonadaceae]|uniref:PEP-CTERM sorting domain-containing protein n=1 Tax=Halomonadaceae TaxID=28256 RepID=UPI001928CAF8|nr:MULTISPECIES: PEP-CTERM sorting domain-containing protein [Halomonas]
MQKPTSIPHSSRALVMGFLLLPAAAMAAPYTFDSGTGLNDAHSCSSGGAYIISTGNVTANNADATNCFGAYGGNPSQLLPNSAPLAWNGDNWDFIAKIDDAGSDLLSADLNQNQGDWSYSGDVSNWASFFVVTKASNNPGWAAYYFDDTQGASTLSGTFFIPWVNEGGNNGPDLSAAEEGGSALSNLSLYARRVAQVPEPATLGLMGLGLLGLGLGRRQRAQ